MPFVSSAQRKWMYANKPKIAKQWEKKTPKNKKLPKKKSKSESITNRIDAMLERNQTRPIIISKFNYELNLVLNKLGDIYAKKNSDR